MDAPGPPSMSSWFFQRRTSLPQTNGSASDPYSCLYLNLGFTESPSPTDSMRRNSATSEHTDSWRGISTAASLADMPEFERSGGRSRSLGRDRRPPCLPVALSLFPALYSTVPRENGVQSAGVASRRCPCARGVWPAPTVCGPVIGRHHTFQGHYIVHTSTPGKRYCASDDDSREACSKRKAMTKEYSDKGCFRYCHYCSGD